MMGSPREDSKVSAIMASVIMSFLLDPSLMLSVRAGFDGLNVEAIGKCGLQQLDKVKGSGGYVGLRGSWFALGSTGGRVEGRRCRFEVVVRGVRRELCGSSVVESENSWGLSVEEEMKASIMGTLTLGDAIWIDGDIKPRV
ncbi:hypothetical protein M5K25_024413 [Dendrobium thyrsiflorum]|uniref:Uncharacterized protein n=1 Tax=Dendrobium thyrsiflorum TaxID=117978 RepID=A0ABD0U2B4_DENTH